MLHGNVLGGQGDGGGCHEARGQVHGGDDCQDGDDGSNFPFPRLALTQASF